MARVVDIATKRAEQLSRAIEAELRTHSGTVTVPLAEVGDVDDWRRAARMAGRRIGTPIRTWVGQTEVAAWLLAPVTDKQDREAAQRVGLFIMAAEEPRDGPTPS